MIQVVNKEDCNGCKGCFNICPESCIVMKTDIEGFWYPKIDLNICVDCGMCVRICPEQDVKEVVLQGENPLVYAAWNKDEEIRLKSSSGGVFSLLAKDVIKQGGVVLGAGYDDDLKVRHQKVERVSDIYKLRGSKYVQSDTGTTFLETKELLEEGKLVLFSGTPCQVAGLNNFLFLKKFDNLYTVDLVCHGVPSPKIYEKYVNRLQELHGKIADIVFRDKKNGWRNYSFSYVLKNKAGYNESRSKNTYMKGFLRDLYLRPSCHSCSFKTINRQADITLADFWGVANKYPELDDDKGTSLLFVHSEKGKKLLEKCESQLELHKVELEYAVRHNSAMIKSVIPHKNRDKFFRELERGEHEIIKLIEKYAQYDFIVRVKGLARRVCSRVKRLLIRN